MLLHQSFYSFALRRNQRLALSTSKPPRWPLPRRPAALRQGLGTQATRHQKVRRRACLARTSYTCFATKETVLVGISSSSTYGGTTMRYIPPLFPSFRRPPMSLTRSLQGGTIRGSINLPAQSLWPTIPTLYEVFKAAGLRRIVWYCGEPSHPLLVFAWCFRSAYSSRFFARSWQPGGELVRGPYRKQGRR